MNNENTVQTVAIATNEKGQVSTNALDYSNWLNYLKDVTKCTTKENSLNVKFDIIDNTCQLQITLLTASGNQDICNQTFQYENSIRTGLIEPILMHWVENNKIILEDISEVNNVFTYKGTTINNDFIILSGITQEYANLLVDICKKVAIPNEIEQPVVVSNINERGISDTLIIVFTFVMIAIALIGTIVFAIMNRT